MNIQQAREHIRNAITAYRTRDVLGRPVIPVQRQRPIFLIGAPGIGKTAIMEQISQELGLPLVSYSMTHHTRQSALGLPFITDKDFGGQIHRTTEYTMSEIIAAVHEKMEQTGVKEGILFLDELNCVSETLSPAMLQFLQYKTFGQHRVPDGWIIVTAGNPPEYNDSVHEFDMVTMDRVKCIQVEASFETWRGWAMDAGVHPAVISYLDVRRDDFCTTENTVDGRRFVTPRGWVDLSDMLRLYERHGFEVDRDLTGQYLRKPEVATSFASYYALWLRYRSDYQVSDILSGRWSDELLQRARSAAFDERISLLGLLMDALLITLRPAMVSRSMLEMATKKLQELIAISAGRGIELDAVLAEHVRLASEELQRQVEASMLNRRDEEIRRQLIALLQECRSECTGSAKEDMAAVKRVFAAHRSEMRQAFQSISDQMDNMLTFVEKAFGEGHEMLVMITELTSSADAARFISLQGCDAYFRHNKELLFHERRLDVLRRLDEMEEDGMEEL